MQESTNNAVGTIRRFNRYYTNVLGLLDQHFLESDYSLSEVRVLHEIGKTADCTSKMLTETLCMDAGYLSRILKQFQKNGLIEKHPSPTDGRAQLLCLTADGRVQMECLNARSDEQIAALIEPLPLEHQRRLVRDMASIERILSGGPALRLEDITIRTEIRTGDAGFITYLHGWVYRDEYGYTTAFEAHVAKSLADFLDAYQPERDRLWMAEHNGEIIGCLGLDCHSGEAHLRWFVLHPDYRGIGLGRKLLHDALAFCRAAGWATVHLGTTSDLTQAIGMYTRAGFVQVGAHENQTWSKGLTQLEFELTFDSPQ